MANVNYRERLIKIVTFLGGLYFFLEYVLPESMFGFEFGKYDDQISKGFIVVGAMAFGLGLINLLLVHGSKIAFRRKGWINSIALMGGLFSMLIVASADWSATSGQAAKAGQFFMLRDFSLKIKTDFDGQKLDAAGLKEKEVLLAAAARTAIERSRAEVAELVTPSLPPENPEAISFAAYRAALKEAQRDAGLKIMRLEDGTEAARHADLASALDRLGGAERDLLSLAYKFSTLKKVYGVLYDSLFMALGTAMFSLLGFYMAAAAYRAFRIRSAESALMMTAAILVMLGQIPFGIWLWHGFPDIRLWLLSTPSSAAFRAIKLGAAVAGVVMAIRMWTSIESGSFAEKKR